MSDNKIYNYTKNRLPARSRSRELRERGLSSAGSTTFINKENEPQETVDTSDFIKKSDIITSELPEESIFPRDNNILSALKSFASFFKLSNILKTDMPEEEATDDRVFSALKTVTSFLGLKNLVPTESEAQQIASAKVLTRGKAEEQFLRKDTEDQAARKITFREGLIACSSGTDAVDNGIIESGDGAESASLDYGVVEQSGFQGAATLGGLENVTAEADNADEKDVVIYKAAGSSHWEIKALSELGGGAAGGITMKVKSISNTLLTGIAGGQIRIEYEFSSVYSDDGTSTGPGTAVYRINDQVVSTQSIGQGPVVFDISKWMSPGTNKVRAEVRDSAGNTRSLIYSVEIINLSLSSTFDASQIFAGSISFKYTPSGAVSKTVHFILDGLEIGNAVTSASNRQMSYSIPAQPHGSHLLKVYLSAEVNSQTVESNALYYDLICTEEGNMTPVIASAFRQAAAEQYDTLSIPFIVYDPASSSADITLSVNGRTVSRQTVGRTRQIWTYRLDTAGSTELSIACGETGKTFTVAVTESSVIALPETQDLVLFLSSANRSNNDNNREIWTYGNISAELTGFNWNTNGWITDEQGSVCLRISGDARVRIPYRIFEEDFRQNGKTIEFEFSTRDVTDYETVIIDCLANSVGLRDTAQKASLSSEQTDLSTRFKEEERVRISFIVEEKTENRLIYIFINGVMSGVAQYPPQDNFQQSEPAGITIGSNDCTTDLYNIRIYNNNLTRYQALDNYIADMDDPDKKLETFHKNRIFNEYGDIMYSKVLERLPCMILEGELPAYKGDKKTNKLYYTDLQDPARSFTCENIQNDVQGTSSQYYPRKNFKFKFKTDITYTETGQTASSYALRADSIPVNCFCVKADFAESSGTHNTGMAKIIDRLLKKMNILTPPQKTDSRVRTTVDGFPICIFHRKTADDELKFVGKYNFNNDKSTEATFGFTEGDQCWEFLNNTSDNVLFKTADFVSRTDGKPNWLNDFEARYPDSDELNAGYENGNIPADFREIVSWIASTENDPEKFRTELEEHFIKDNLIAYYLVTEIFGMVDQRAKNMFLTHYHQEVSPSGNKLWRFIFYDNDTCFGINNEGLVAFNYNIEYHDTEGTQNVFNGEGSVLWNNLEAGFSGEIASMYKEIRSKGYLSYDNVMDVLNGEQCDKWCEAIYNMDSQFKYIDPLIENGNGSYLYAAQGSRKEHRKWWTYNRFRYMDSKYNAGDYLSDYATMRLYTPQNWTGVAPDADFTLVPSGDQYLRVKYGSYIVEGRGNKDVPMKIPAPEIVFNDTETIVYGAGRIRSLGNLSAKYPGTVDVHMATQLTELVIGSPADGYANTNLTTVSVGTNKLLRLIDVRNCPNLRQPLDLSGCENLERVYAQGTGLTSVVLAEGGILRELRLPGSITNLTIKNQPDLTDDSFSMEGVENLTTLILENMNHLNVFAFLSRCLAQEPVKLNRLRLINIRGTGEGIGIFVPLSKIAGIDENGNNTPQAVITGNYHATGLTAYQDYLEMGNSFPELQITYDLIALRFEDPEVKKVIVNYSQYGIFLDKNKNGELDIDELTTVKTLSNAFTGNTAIKTFDEFKYFINCNFTTDKTFGGCSSLESIVLPDSCVDSKYADFMDCTSLRKVVLPPTRTKLGGHMFHGCTALEEINLESIQEIGQNCFSRSGLKKVNIKNLTLLDDGIFEECKSLLYADLPSSIATIGMRAFLRCTALETLIIRSPAPPETKYGALTTESPVLKIYVPAESVEMYKNTWRNIADKIYSLNDLPV